MDILLSANHKAGKVNIGFNVVVVDRGQYLTSQVGLAKKWLWNRETVKKFLCLLESEEMASIQTSKQASTGYTLITVRNYDKHQSLETEQSSIESSNQPTGKPASTQHPPDTNNNEKNEKNEKKERKVKPSLSNGSDPRVKEFLDWWGKEYLERFLAPYVFTGGKEGGIIKRLLRSHDLSALNSLALRFFDSTDRWIQEKGGYTIGVFASQINKLVSISKTYQPQRKEMPL